MASATWSLTKMDIDAISSALDRLLRASGAHSAMGDALGVLRGAEIEIDRLFS